ncbi:MAG: glutamyl-tRNA reductase [Chloroflexaceae bacterium]|nr:glutamyl-tRNA reductase [Chloroflexaceae bacterium]
MNLFVVGLDHTSASVEVRECLAFSTTDLPSALTQLTAKHEGVAPLFDEAVILSTCNRVEIYGITSDDDLDVKQAVVEFLADFHNLDEEQFASSLFCSQGDEAIFHLFETTAGLRSLVLGEAQIQGQVRKAFNMAQRLRSATTVMPRLFVQAINTGRRVRNETNLGCGAASVSQAGVELARHRFGSLEGCCVLLVGSGQVSELAAQNLIANGADDLLVVNRTYENGLDLAARYGARAMHFEDLIDAMAMADIVISSTAAPSTVIHRAHAEAALQRKLALFHEQHMQHSALELQPELLLIDLAVPRDIDTDVMELAGVHLCTVDDLQEVVQKTLAQRTSAIAAARQIIAEEFDTFQAWLRSQDTLPILSSWRQQAEALRSAELKRAMRHLESLSPEQQYVVEAFSRSLVNKLLHEPTLRTRHAAATGEGKRYAAMLRDLWEL